MQNANFNLNLKNLIFCLRNVQLFPTKLLDIQQSFEGRPALCAINRGARKPNFISAELIYHNWYKIHIGQFANRVFVCLVKSTSFTACYFKKP